MATNIAFTLRSHLQWANPRVNRANRKPTSGGPGALEYY